LNGILETVEYLTAQRYMFQYSKIHQVLGEWNGGKKDAFYDIFRMKEGKIAEHWDLI